MKYDVFISYSSKDSTTAHKLCEYLEQHQLQCWIAPRNVTAGLPYAQAILNGIDESQLMVLLFSENANLSRHVASEVDRAFNKEKIIIPYRISDSAMSDVLSYYLGTNHYIDGIPEPSSGFENLRQQIEKNIPRKQRLSEIDDILAKLAEIKGLTVDELKEAVEALRQSPDDAFDKLLNDFLENEKEVKSGSESPLSNEVGVKGSYSLLQNAKGEIMIMMSAREGKPHGARFIYDGGENAILYRSEDSSVVFRGIEKQAQDAIKKITEILIVEVLNDDVEYEYMAPIRYVNSLDHLLLPSQE